MTQVYAVAIACEKIQDAELEALATGFAAANEDYLTACEKLGMTREIEKAWFQAEEKKVERLLASRYKISPSDSDEAREQKKHRLLPRRAAAFEKTLATAVSIIRA